MYQETQRIRPKFPDGPQPWGQQTEKQHCAPRGPQCHKAAKLPAAPFHQEGEGGSPCQQAVPCIQQCGETGQPQPEGAQQVIQDSERHPQQDGLTEGQQLRRDLCFHPQPNNRLKKPPRLLSPSSYVTESMRPST
jgi:hypothetical protein